MPAGKGKSQTGQAPSDSKANDDDAVRDAVLSGLEERIQTICAASIQGILEKELKPMLTKLASPGTPPSELRRMSATSLSDAKREPNLLEDLARQLKQFNHGRRGSLPDSGDDPDVLRDLARHLKANRGRRGSLAVGDDSGDEEPVLDIGDQRLGPDMLERVKLYGSCKAWVRYQLKWDSRSLREATVLAAAADAFIQERVPKDSVGLEIILRRLCALQAVEQYGNWDIAEAMSWDSESTSLMPQKALESFVKKANARNSLRKKASSGNSGRSGGKSKGGGKSQRSNDPGGGQPGGGHGAARASRGPGAGAP